MLQTNALITNITFFLVSLYALVSEGLESQSCFNFSNVFFLQKLIGDLIKRGFVDKELAKVIYGESFLAELARKDEL